VICPKHTVKTLEVCCILFFVTMFVIPNPSFHFALLFSITFPNVCLSKYICFITFLVHCFIFETRMHIVRPLLSFYIVDFLLFQNMFSNVIVFCYISLCAFALLSHFLFIFNVYTTTLKEG
jgi:hypothetical protein